MPRHGSGHPKLDVVIPGAQKSGTSTLIDLLGQHPSMARHETDEYSPLMNPEVDLGPAVAEDYGRAGADQLFLAKSAGVLHTPTALERLLQHNPEVRFVVMLRDPAKRAFSAYLHARRVGDEPEGDFLRAWRAQPGPSEERGDRSFFLEYRRRSQYVAPLRRIRDEVGRDRLYIATLEALQANQDAQLDDMLQWLGLERFHTAPPARRANRAADSRLTSVAHFLRGNALPQRALKMLVPRRARRSAFKAVDRLNRREASTPQMSDVAYSSISQEFSEHNRLLEREFKVDTSHWRYE